MLRACQSWRWTGAAVRLDGPADILPLGDALGMAELRQRSARAVRHLLAAVAADVDRFDRVGVTPALSDGGFTVTNGRQVWTVALNDTAPGRPPLAVFPDGLAPRGTELWVVAIADRRPSDRVRPAPPGTMICFTPGTLISTETGPVPVEALSEGCRLQTKDNGCQPLLWIGRQHLSGARLHALPHLAPVRLRAGALDHRVAEAGLLVSPDHRLVLRGPRAQALFNTDEVLVAARDLINDGTIRVERGLRDLTYLHLLLPAHEILFANGVEAESFHPASADLSVMDARFDALCPGMRADPSRFGGTARRSLAQSEAAILQFDRV
jgi:hypothetical protein